MVAYLNRHQQILAITALAALLRLPTLAVESLWYDETFTAWLAKLPIGQLVSATMADVHPPTWYLLEWVIVHTLGSSEFSLRLISAIAGVLLVPAVYRLAQSFELIKPQPAAAALLTAVAPFMVYYSQEARAYSLIYLLTTLATIGLLERRWLLLVAAATAAMYLHNLAVFYVAALGWLAVWRYRRCWQMWVSFFAIGLLWLPWFVVGMLPQFGDVRDGFWLREPSIGTPFFTIVSFLFSGHGLLLVLVSTPIVALALLLPRPMAAATQWQLFGLMLLPLGLCIIASMVAAPVLVERVIGSSAIPMYLLIAPALTMPLFVQPQSWRPYALPLAFAATIAVFYATYWGTDRIGRYPWDFGLKPMLSQLSPNDGLFHANLATYIVLNYYLPNDQWVWQQANDLSQSLTGEAKLSMEMQQAQFEGVACKHNRWWLAFYENPTTSDRERNEIARIVAKYHGQKVVTILNNILVDARVYRLDNVCGVAQR